MTRPRDFRLVFKRKGASFLLHLKSTNVFVPDSQDRHVHKKDESLLITAPYIPFCAFFSFILCGWIDFNALENMGSQSLIDCECDFYRWICERDFIWTDCFMPSHSHVCWPSELYRLLKLIYFLRIYLPTAHTCYFITVTVLRLGINLMVKVMFTCSFKFFCVTFTH